MSSVELLLHPVRLRIVQAFLGDRILTTGQLLAELPDVPPASLYRHVARLVAGGVLRVAAERRARGAVERAYELQVTTANSAVDEELPAMNVEEHRAAFIAFVAGLLSDFDRYLAGGDIDLARDGVSYRLTGLWLDDAELVALLREIADLFAPRLANKPRRGRRRRILASILLPGEQAPYQG